MNSHKAKIKKEVKKHIPKDWLCELRIAYRIVMEARRADRRRKRDYPERMSDQLL